MTNRNLVPERTQGSKRLQALLERGRAIREAQAGTALKTGTEDTSFIKTLTQPLVTPEMVEKLPEWLQPVGTIGRELTSPTQLALLALTAGYGPAISVALRGGTGALGVARGIAASAIAPVVRAPFPVRFAAEAGLVGGAEAGILGAEKLTEDAPAPVQIGAGIVGGLAGGIGAVGAIRGLAGARGFAAPAVREAIPAARGAEELLPGSGITPNTILPGQTKPLREISNAELKKRIAREEPKTGKRAFARRKRIYEAELKRRPRIAAVRLSIRSTEREGGGFLISGRDTMGRQVRVFAKTLDEAKAAKENIRQGFEPLPRTEMQAAEKELKNATRAFRTAEKRGESGAIQRTTLRLDRAARSLRSLTAERTRVDAPPKPPPKIDPDGTLTPPEDWNNARNRLVAIIRGATMRKTSREIAALRARERSRVGGTAEEQYRAAEARGESAEYLRAIRGAQKGSKIKVPELVVSERLTKEEADVLRQSIYDKLGPELRMTAANIDEALTRFATEGMLPTDGELRWMEEIFGPDMVVALRDLRPRSAKVIEELMKLWNLPRALMASFDDSAVLRQGAMLLPEGKIAWRAWRSHWKVIKASGAQALEDEVRGNTYFNHARAHGLDFTFPSIGGGMAGAEEPFMGVGIAEKIWGIGKAIRISERLYSGYLNKLRMDVYASHAAELTRMGARTAAFDELATNINILSGRATLPSGVQAIAPLLNGIFFSARLNWARMQAPLRIFWLQNKSPEIGVGVGTPEGRHLARMLARDVYGYYAGVLGMLGLASAAGVAKVEWDSRSADFGKAQVGTVRIDPWAGQQQLAVLISRIASGERKTTTTRQLVPARDLDTLMRFVESKFHPALSQTLSVKRGETYFGDDLTLGEFATSWYPLFLQDIAEIHEGASPGVATVLGLAAFSGVSVYNIPGVPSVVLDQLQDAVDTYNAIPTDALELAPGQQSRTRYRIRNPQADAALFIAGQVSSLRTMVAVREVASIIQENGINPDMVRGIDQRKEALKKARDVGRRLPRNAVDRLIELLETSPTATAQRPRTTQAATPAPEMTGVR